MIVIGFLGLFITNSMSFSKATVSVDSKLSITNSNHGLISADDLNVHLTEKKGQNEVMRITNHLSVPIHLSKDDIYPLADDKFFHIMIEPVTIPPGSSTDAEIVVFAHKNKTPSGDYDMSLHMTWDNGSSDIPIQLYLDNDLHPEKDTDSETVEN